MDLEGLILSSVSQTQKDEYRMIPTYSRSPEESDSWRQKGSGRWGLGRGERVALGGRRDSVLQDVSVLWVAGGDGGTTA